MFRTITALAAAATFCGIASADRLETFETELVFDRAQLETEAGAQKVLKSLTTQARYACRHLSMERVGFKVDEACAARVVEQAVQKIGAATLEQAHLSTTDEASS